MRDLVLSIGANRTGPWGKPPETIGRALRKLVEAGIGLRMASALYRTAPVGGPAQAPYVNAVIVARCNLPPGAVLRALKRIERQAGRRSRGRWAARELDIDIIDDRYRSCGWDRPRGRTEPGKLGQTGIRSGLRLPHPLAHVRPFVLVPLIEVAPHWCHPRLGRSGRGLLHRASRRPGDVAALGPCRPG